MSVPVESDYAVIKVSDGAAVPVFTVLCGIDNIDWNSTSEVLERARRDCDTPWLPAVRLLTGGTKKLDVSGSGAIDKPNFKKFNDLLGFVQDYKIEFYQRIVTPITGVPAGKLWATGEGKFMLSSSQVTAGDQGAEGNITLQSHGTWSVVTAPD